MEKPIMPDFVILKEVSYKHSADLLYIDFFLYQVSPAEAYRFMLNERYVLRKETWQRLVVPNFNWFFHLKFKEDPRPEKNLTLLRSTGQPCYLVEPLLD